MNWRPIKEIRNLRKEGLENIQYKCLFTYKEFDIYELGMITIFSENDISLTYKDGETYFEFEQEDFPEYFLILEHPNYETKN